MKHITLMTKKIIAMITTVVVLFDYLERHMQHKKFNLVLEVISFEKNV